MAELSGFARHVGACCQQWKLMLDLQAGTQPPLATVVNNSWVLWELKTVQLFMCTTEKQFGGCFFFFFFFFFVGTKFYVMSSIDRQ